MSVYELLTGPIIGFLFVTMLELKKLKKRVRELEENEKERHPQARR